MIKTPLQKGTLEIIVGTRHKTDEDPLPFEAHIYLKKGAEMHGGIGKTPAEALFNAVAHWRQHEDKEAEKP